MGPGARIFQRVPQFASPLASKFRLVGQIRGLATQVEPRFRKTGASIGFSRLQDYYHDVVQENIMILKYEYPGEDFELSPPPVKMKKVFRGPVLGEDGLYHRKKGSINPRRPRPLPVTPFNIPELNFIQVNLTMSGAITNKYVLLSAFLLLQSITGEMANTIFSKSDVALIKLRKGMPLGAMVTLTGGAMYAFLDKLVEVVLPRIKEWNGLAINAGDGTGNLAMGLSSSAVSQFPDIEPIYDAIPNLSGLHVLLNTNACRNYNARLLMSALQIPFVKRGEN